MGGVTTPGAAGPAAASGCDDGMGAPSVPRGSGTRPSPEACTRMGIGMHAHTRMGMGMQIGSSRTCVGFENKRTRGGEG